MKRERISQVCGFVVEFDPESDNYADARGFWPFRRWIAVGPEWLKLPHRQRLAVLYHEAGHCFHRHFEKRLAMLPLLLLFPEFAFERCHKQELEADEFAARNGLALELAAFLQRHNQPESLFYPSCERRIERLRPRMEESCSSA